MTVLRQTFLVLALTSAPAFATPSGLAETFAACVGRLEASYAPRVEIDAMEDLLDAAMPAALDWGMPENHVKIVRSRAWKVQRNLQSSAAFADDPIAARHARTAATEALNQCRSMLPMADAG
ncbi:MAG: hypothetical protein AAF366_10080 [Pseudomonadota bacterium]